MSKYCITAANHENRDDDRASEFKAWESTVDPDSKKWIWRRLPGKKSLNDVAALLVAGHEVLSAKEVRKDGKLVRLDTGAAIEIELRIAKNEEDFKITDLPTFK